MPDKAMSVVWIDANGRTRQTIYKSLAGAAGIQAAAGAMSNAVLQDSWESFLSGGVLVPTAALYQAVADAAQLTFQTGTGSILRLTVPAPVIAAFMPDHVTLDPANAGVVALVAACVGSLSDGAGNAAVSYLGGRYLRGNRTDLDTP